MDCRLDALSNSGDNPLIYMDISVNDQPVGRMVFKMLRDSFPAGEENFVGIATNKTSRNSPKGYGIHKYVRQVDRNFNDTNIYDWVHNNYLIGGDIYNNNGTDAGTIFGDQPIPAELGDYYYPNEIKGLLSLIPYRDDAGNLYYDSTFMITLKSDLDDLDPDQVVIGQLTEGNDVLDTVNRMIFPFAGRRKPKVTITKTGQVSNRRRINRN